MIRNKKAEQLIKKADSIKKSFDNLIDNILKNTESLDKLQNDSHALLKAASEIKRKTTKNAITINIDKNFIYDDLKSKSKSVLKFIKSKKKDDIEAGIISYCTTVNLFLNFINELKTKLEKKHSKDKNFVFKPDVEISKLEKLNKSFEKYCTNYNDDDLNKVIKNIESIGEIK